MSEMDDSKWAAFLRACADVLSVERSDKVAPSENGTWCAWTTFDTLESDLNYWRGPLPTKDEIFDSYVGHGKNWSQYFFYRDFCHFLVPRTFFWERASLGNYERGDVKQDIDALSRRLNELDVPHRLTPIILEIKLF